MPRKVFYEWLEDEKIPRSPRAETLRRICAGLHEDYSVPAKIMGWDQTEETTPSVLAAQIKRAEAYLRLDLPPAQREEYERVLGDLIAMNEAVLQRYFQRAEAEFSQKREAKESEPGTD